MAIDKELLTYFQHLGALFPPLAADATASVRRERYLAITRVLPEANLNGLDVEDLSLDLPGRSLRAKRYTPTAHKPQKLLVYFHGGGWVIGDLESHHALCADLARALGASVISIDYRLAPEHVFPAAHDDAVDSVRWCAARLLSFGCSELMVGGDSAGANLAAHATYANQDMEAANVSAQYLIYPVVEPNFQRPSYLSNAAGPGLTSADMQWYWHTYCPFESTLAATNDVRLRLMSQQWSKPPVTTIILTAGLDPLCDEGLAYAHFLAQQGAPLRLIHAPDMTHGFIRLGVTSGAVRAWFARLTQ
jgi:acetyl esterase